MVDIKVPKSAINYYHAWEIHPSEGRIPWFGVALYGVKRCQTQSGSQAAFNMAHCHFGDGAIPKPR